MKNFDKKQIDIFKVLSLKEVSHLNRMLEKYELKFDTQTLLEYVKKSTIIREENKFNFTKYLSDFLESVTELGKINDYTEDLSF